MHLKTLTLVFTLTLTSALCKAQAPVIGPDYQEKTAGFELLKASKHFYTGTILEGAGFVVIDVGAAGKGNTGLIILGSVGFVTGLVFVIESYSHIGKAGTILMDQHKLNLGATNSGFGLSYKF